MSKNLHLGSGGILLKYLQFLELIESYISLMQLGFTTWGACKLQGIPVGPEGVHVGTLMIDHLGIQLP